MNDSFDPFSYYVKNLFSVRKLFLPLRNFIFSLSPEHPYRSPNPPFRFPSLLFRGLKILPQFIARDRAFVKMIYEPRSVTNVNGAVSRTATDLISYMYIYIETLPRGNWRKVLAVPATRLGYRWHESDTCFSRICAAEWMMRYDSAQKVFNGKLCSFSPVAPFSDLFEAIRRRCKEASRINIDREKWVSP